MIACRKVGNVRTAGHGAKRVGINECVVGLLAPGGRMAVRLGRVVLSSRLCPVCPTRYGQWCVSTINAMCQEPDSCSAAKSSLFDHLIGEQ